MKTTEKKPELNETNKARRQEVLLKLRSNVKAGNVPLIGCWGISA